MAKAKKSVLVIEGRFYEDIANELAHGAITELDSRGVEYERVSVPGALEIPIALAIAIANGNVSATGRHQGCIALGCVIRGETSHYDIVAQESARALLDLGIAHGIPIGNGILTVDNREQAWARASVEKTNKGRSAAIACLTLMGLETGQLSGKGK